DGSFFKSAWPGVGNIMTSLPRPCRHANREYRVIPAMTWRITENGECAAFVSHLVLCGTLP
ncbi:hypothetical protein BaRGS_00018920, partial [Batillaria attramentaria]